MYFLNRLQVQRLKKHQWREYWVTKVTKSLHISQLSSPPLLTLEVFQVDPCNNEYKLFLHRFAQFHWSNLRSNAGHLANTQSAIDASVSRLFPEGEKYMNILTWFELHWVRLASSNLCSLYGNSWIPINKKASFHNYCIMVQGRLTIIIYAIKIKARCWSYLNNRLSTSFMDDALPWSSNLTLEIVVCHIPVDNQPPWMLNKVLHQSLRQLYMYI